MVSGRSKIKYGGLGLLAFLLALVCAAQAAYPPQADIGVVKSAPVQVTPGLAFDYTITVRNYHPTNSCPDVVLTDKLPYEVAYTGIDVVGGGPNTTSITGDLIYVKYEEFPPNGVSTVTISVTAPEAAPTTLYNIANVRYGGDNNSSNNRVTVPTYVVQVGYNQTVAAFSFEDLLHNQSQLLFQFEDLLHTIPSNNSTNYSFLVSFEQLLRAQADLTSSFEDLLTNETNTGWDTEYNETNRTALLWSYEQMLYDEAFLFASFNMKINDSFVDMCNYTKTGHTQDGQTELIASFEDLLHRQNRLYKSFNVLFDDLNTTDSDVMIDFLDAYENLLRIEANLYMSFYNLLNMKYENYVCD